MGYEWGHEEIVFIWLCSCIDLFCALTSLKYQSCYFYKVGEQMISWFAPQPAQNPKPIPSEALQKYPAR